jgi:hypothetical protein
MKLRKASSRRTSSGAKWLGRLVKRLSAANAATLTGVLDGLQAMFAP